MPRLTTTSASACAVPWVRGRPDCAGRARDGEDLGDLLGSERAGGAETGFVAEDRFEGAAPDGAGRAALQRDELIPGLGPPPSPASDLAACQADLVGDLLMAEAVEGQADDGGP